MNDIVEGSSSLRHRSESKMQGYGLFLLEFINLDPLLLPHLSDRNRMQFCSSLIQITVFWSKSEVLE